MATLVALDPQPTWAELEALGVGVAFYPGHGMMAGNIANWDFLQDFKKRGAAAEAELKARTKGHPLAGFGLFDLVGFPKVREMEERYLGAGAQEKYTQSKGMYTPGAGGMRRTTQLRRLLERREIVVAPLADCAYTAKVIEAAGFPAVYLSGRRHRRARCSACPTPAW